MKADQQYDINSTFSKKCFDALKGYLALCILLHHIFLSNGLLVGTILNYPQFLVGHWAVVLFMFISGFGLYESYKNKGRDYIRRFPLHRLLPFYLTYLVIVLIYVIYYLVNHLEITGKMMLQTFTIGSTIVYYGWYFQLSFLIYLVFWVIFLIPAKPKIHSLLFLVFICIFTFANIYFSIHFNNFTPAYSFLFGMFISVHKESVKKFLNRFKYPNIFACLAVFCIFTILTTLIVYRKETELYSIAYMKLIYIGLTIFADVALCMFMINITAIFNRITPYIIQNPVSLFISRYSLEIYALQGMIIIVVFKYSPNIYAASAVSFIVTILLAIPLHYLLQFILKPIKGLNKKKETK